MQKVARNEKVVRNTRSCQKVAEQLVESPKRGSLFGCPWGQRPIKKYLPSMSKNYKMADRTPRRHLRVSFLLHWGWFLQEGGGGVGGACHFRSSGKQTCKSIWIKQHWIIAWGYWPYVFAGWLSKYSIRWVVSLRGICRNRCLATVPTGKASTCCISFWVSQKDFSQLQERNNLFVDRPVK